MLDSDSTNAADLNDVATFLDGLEPAADEHRGLKAMVFGLAPHLLTLRYEKRYRLRAIVAALATKGIVIAEATLRLYLAEYERARGARRKRKRRRARAGTTSATGTRTAPASQVGTKAANERTKPATPAGTNPRAIDRVESGKQPAHGDFVPDVRAEDL